MNFCLTSSYSLQVCRHATVAEGNEVAARLLSQDYLKRVATAITTATIRKQRARRIRIVATVRVDTLVLDVQQSRCNGNAVVTIIPGASKNQTLCQPS